MTLLNEDTDEKHVIWVEYVHENCFNAFLEEENGILTSIIMNAEVEMNPFVPDDLIVRTEHEQFKVDFYIDEDGNVT